MPDLPANIASTPRELPIPPGAIATMGSVEVLRAWVVEGALHVTLDPAFPTPETWGVLLADVARHAARAFASEDRCGEAEALSRIERAIEAEFAHPTDIGTTTTQRSQ